MTTILKAQKVEDGIGPVPNDEAQVSPAPQPLPPQDEMIRQICQVLNIEGLFLELCTAPAGEEPRGKYSTYESSLSEDRYRELIAGGNNCFMLNGVSREAVRNKEASAFSRTRNEDVMMKTFVVQDLDLKDIVRKETLDGMDADKREEHVGRIVEKALPRLSEAGLWMAVFSGNGLHLYFKFASPILIDESFKARYVAFCEYINKKVFESKVIFDQAMAKASQLIRMPLSTNSKRSPAVDSKILFFNPSAVTSEEIAQLFIGALPEKERKETKQKSASWVQKIPIESILKHFNVPFEPSKQGSEIVISSPFSHDTTPSFSINTDKNVWHCFSTSRSGGAYALIAALANLDPDEKPEAVFQIAKEIADANKIEIPKTKASYQDHIDFARGLPGIGEIKKCKISGEIMVKSLEGWIPLEQRLKYLKGYAREFDGYYCLSAFQDYFARYEIDHLKPELLVDIPGWDGIDRIAEIASVVEVEGLEKEHVCQLFKEFLSTLFRRLDDPTIQPITPIFMGPQGVGKDSLASALVDGLGDYVVNFNPSLGLEAEKVLHSAIVFKIGEFDKTGRTDVAALKHYLTADSTYVRLSYDARPVKRAVRASYLATCNVVDVLRDHTGNRRYRVFRITFAGHRQIGINAQGLPEFERYPSVRYPGHWSRPNYAEERIQILAQGLALSKERYLAGAAATAAAQKIVGELTPPDPEQEALEMWFDFWETASDTVVDIEKIRLRGWATNDEIAKLRVMEQIRDASGLLEKRIRTLLSRVGLKHNAKVNGKSHNGYFVQQIKKSN